MKTIAGQKYATFLSHRQAGLTLVELMVSLTIGLILLAGMTTLIVQQSSARDELEKASRQIENGRYAVQLLHNDIQLAGFYGEYAPPSGITYTTPAPCATAVANLGWTPTVPVPIFGYSSTATKPSCLDHYMPNTAVLVIRRTDTVSIAAAAAVAGTTYLQVSRCNTESNPFVLGTAGSISFNLHQMDCTEASPGTLATLRKNIVRIYYISTCDVCGSDSIPTLKVVEFNGVFGSVPTPTPLVEGIENMRFDYGVDTNGDGSPDSYCTDPDIPSTCTATAPPDPAVSGKSNWPDVMAVRVNLLARNSDLTAGYQDTKTYNLSGITGVAPIGPFNDTYKRHVFSELVRAINPSGRREQP